MRGIVLVGYGRRGREWHQACRDRSDVVIVGVVEPEGTAARAAALDAGLPVFDSPAAAVAAAIPAGVPVTAAIVASPIETHPPVALACLEAGLAVLVEKPLAQTVAAARQVVDAAAARHLPALVVQNFRFLPRERALIRALADGLVGRLVSAEVDSARAVRSPVALWDFAVHHLDALRVRLGGPPATVTATPSAALDVVLTWADGFEVRYRHDDAAPGYRYRERLVGDDGTLTVVDQNVRLERGGRRPRRVRAPGRVDPDAAVLDELVRALAGGPSSPLAAADNLLTVATVVAVAKAVREGGTVTVEHG